MNDYPELRNEYWAMLTKALDEAEDPIKTDDPWQATVEVCLRSYDALPLIGQAAVAATRTMQANPTIDTAVFFHFRGQCMGREMSVMEMKAQQQAWAVIRIQRLWRQAWDAAMKNEK